MGAAQDLDKPDLAAATAGLWDNRSNYDASGNVYPSTGGSGTSGAVLKSDQWRISVAGTLGGTAVSVGDVLVALVDTPGSTSSNWMVLQGNVVAFTGDSGSGGSEGLVPAPAAGDSAANKFLKANGQWASISAPNLGSANLVSADNARTFTLKSGGTASQNLAFLNDGGGNLLTLRGNKSIDFGSSTNTINPKFYLDGDIYQYFRIYNKTNANSICDIFAGVSYGNGVFYLKNSLGTANISMNAGIGATPQMAIMSLAGQYSRYRVYNSLGNIVVNLGASNSDKGDLELYNSSGNIKVNITAGYSVFDAFMKVGGSFAVATAQLQVVGSGSTSATTTALFQNSSSVTALKIRDDNYLIQRAINAAIPNADLANNEMSAYIDESLNLLIFKVKYSGGTVKTVSLALI
jgi:hypothetical protein